MGPFRRIAGTAVAPGLTATTSFCLDRVAQTVNQRSFHHGYRLLRVSVAHVGEMPLDKLQDGF